LIDEVLMSAVLTASSHHQQQTTQLARVTLQQL